MYGSPFALATLFFLFGIEVSDSKSVLEPSTSVEFLGFVVSVDGKLSLSQSRHAKVTRMAKKLLHCHNSERRFVPFKLLRSFLGVAVSCYEAVQRACLNCFHLFACPNKYQKCYSTSPGFDAKRGLTGQRPKLTKPALRELLYWVQLDFSTCYLIMCLPKGISFLYTDASSRLWGAVLVQNGINTAVSGFSPPDIQTCHIGVKDLFTIHASILAFESVVANTRLVLFCDNLPGV